MRVTTLATWAIATAMLCPGCYIPLDDGPTSKGSGSAWDGNTYDPYSLPPDACMPPPAVFAQMRQLHDDNEAKVHELIKCGGMQTSMSRNFLIVVIASNRDLFDQASYNDLVAFAKTYDVDLQIPFNRESEGRWTMPINPLTNSVFTVRFYDTGSGSVIQEDPFTIDTYLKGVTAESSLTIAEMKADLFARTTITFSWTELGLLSDELNRGRPIPNPFTISVSFADLAQFVWGLDLASGDPNLGPLDSIQDMKVDSEVVLRDDVGATHVEYDVDGLAGTIRGVAANGVSFGVKRIEATNGAYRMTGSASGLRYAAGPGTLVGTFAYRISGPDGDLTVTDSYDPSRGLGVRWSCAK